MSERRYDLDWLRFIAIVLLHAFHTGMLYVPWWWHIKSPVISGVFEPPMAWLHYWRMPLLFVISGAGTWYALRRRSPGQYLGERARRLLLPLVVGMLVVVPPQIYFERKDLFGSYWEFWKTVFDFVPYPLGGSFSWHHLWFILYLFLMSALALPVMLGWKSEKGHVWRDRFYRLVSRPAGLAWFLIPLLGSQFLLRPFFHEFSTGALIDDWAAFAFYGLLFFAGYMCMADQRIWGIIRDQRRTYLMLAVASMVPFFLARYITYRIGFFGFDFIYGVPSGAMSWFTVVAVLGYGQAYLNRPSRALPYINEALYPFYILHQTAIIVVAWYLMPRVPGIAPGYLSVFFISGAGSVLVYHFLIRPFNPVRILFGMKPRSRRALDARPCLPAHSEPVPVVDRRMT